MTERRMSPKGFLHKANCKAGLSAKGFISAWRDYLTTGEVAYLTSPIVEKWESGELMNTPAMDEIRAAVMAHIIEVNRIAGIEALERANAPKAEKVAKESTGSTRAKKPFQAVIRDGSGLTALDDNGDPIKASFDLPQRAQDWCDRRLFQQPSDSFAEIFNHEVHYEFVLRDNSLARIMKSKPGAVMRHQKSGGGGLSFGVKCKPSVSKFSHG